MSFACRHRWTDVARKSVPGVLETGAPFEFGGGLRNPNTPSILYGFTTIEWRCEKCGRMRMQTGVGTVETGAAAATWTTATGEGSPFLPEAGKR